MKEFQGKKKYSLIASSGIAKYRLYSRCFVCTSLRSSKPVVKSWYNMWIDSTRIYLRKKWSPGLATTKNTKKRIWFSELTNIIFSRVVDGSEIQRSPVEVGSLSHSLRCVFLSQVLQDFLSSINNIPSYMLGKNLQMGWTNPRGPPRIAPFPQEIRQCIGNIKGLWTTIIPLMNHFYPFFIPLIRS